MRTLYVSDLDGTLLRSDEHTSAYTNRVLNELTKRGMLFSYATARSLSTSHRVTAGLTATIPLIVYNGAFIVNNVTGEIIHSVDFAGEGSQIIETLIANDVYPIVYALINGVEKFSYIPEKSSQAMLDFVATRKGDKRDHPVRSVEELQQGDCFYITCIDSEEKLYPLYQQYQAQQHCVCQKDIYSGEQWLEIMPRKATKANAIAILQKLLDCDRLIVFGDGVNDLDMFALADESYAVANAVPVLKKHATDVIGTNNEDAVANWLKEHAQLCGEKDGYGEK